MTQGHALHRAGRALYMYTTTVSIGLPILTKISSVINITI